MILVMTDINWTVHDDSIEDYNRQQRERWLHDERGTVDATPMPKSWLKKPGPKSKNIDTESEPGSWAKELSRLPKW